MTWREWLAEARKVVDAYRGMAALGGEGWSSKPLDVGKLCWSLWLDPGTHTGLGAVVYYLPPSWSATDAPGGFGKDRISGYGEALRTWQKVVGKLGPGCVPGVNDLCYDATGAMVLAYWAEFMAGDENALVRTCVGRVRQLGELFGGKGWDGFFEGPDGETAGSSGLGKAGVGCESFTNMRADRSRDYLSPVRVTAGFSYAVEDEFGITLLGSNPGDMKSAFGSLVIKELGMWIEGPDHVRDALGHVLFAIRKWG
jgi:hypothetical protein